MNLWEFVSSNPVIALICLFITTEALVRITAIIAIACLGKNANNNNDIESNDDIE